MTLPARSSGPRGGARWTFSFADLCLVLLAFLLLLQAHRNNPALLGASIRQAFGSAESRSFDEAVAASFEPGEAILLPSARARFRAVGRDAAVARAQVHVESLGTDPGGRRFDRWELAAARAAAIARAIGEGGLDARAIDLSIDGTGPAARRAGQHVRVTVSAPR